MFNANDTQYNYENMPSVEKILNYGGFAKMSSILATIENMRYMIYVASYFKNNCVPITDANSILDARYAGLYDSQLRDRLIAKSANNTDVDDFVANIQHIASVIESDCKRLFDRKKDQFVENNPDDADFAKNDNEMYKLFTERTIEWNRLAHRVFYNEIENPIVIDKLLSCLFDPISDCAKYMISAYDFGNYEILFNDEASMNEFVQQCVEVATAFERNDNNAWIELWSV